MPEHVKVESIDGRAHMLFPREEALERLVLDMWDAMLACDNEKCSHDDECCCDGEHCVFADRMRELGIEVDE